MLHSFRGNFAKVDSILIFFNVEVLHVHFAYKLTLGLVVGCNPACIALGEVDIDGMDGSFFGEHKVISICPNSYFSDLGSLCKVVFFLNFRLVIREQIFRFVEIAACVSFLDGKRILRRTCFLCHRVILFHHH